MVKYLAILSVVFISCSKEQVVHAPVGVAEKKNDLHVSKERARALNELERRQIQGWIGRQNEKFYSMPLNYWVNIEKFSERPHRNPTELFSYKFDIFDFFGNKIYAQPKGFLDVSLEKFPNELKAVQDALNYLNEGEVATLLLPSVLAYGTFGDGDKIGNDLPIIVKLQIVK